ncbi:MAG: calcium-binding protein [Pseudorhodobacter sp.]
MLAILGLFGAVCAGFLADAILSSKTATEADEEADTPPEDGDPAPGAALSEGQGGNILDWIDGPTASAAEPISEMPMAQIDSDAMDGAEADDPEQSPLDNTNSRDDGPESSDLPRAAEPGMTIEAQNGDTILTGQGGADSVVGGDGDDLLGGRAGDDLIQGGGGRDVIHGGAGDDTLDGGEGDDTLHGEDGADVIHGGPGNDLLAGHEGDDMLRGGAGNDTLFGGAGDDTLEGDDGDDWLAGGFGNDLLRGGAGNDTLDGNDGNDTLFGFDPDAPDDEADFLNGGNGDDVLWLGANDHGHGGAGADQFRIGDWIGEGGFARIADFDPAEDEIVVVYDAVAHPDPQVSLVEDGDGANVTVLLDGFPLAQIAGGAGLEVSQLRLLAMSNM